MPLKETNTIKTIITIEYIIKSLFHSESEGRSPITIEINRNASMAIPNRFMNFQSLYFPTYNINGTREYQS